MPASIDPLLPVATASASVPAVDPRPVPTPPNDPGLLGFLSRHLLDEQLAIALVHALNPRQATHEQWLGVVALCKGREANILGSRAFWSTVFPDDLNFPEVRNRLTKVEGADSLWEPYRGLFWQSLRGMEQSTILEGINPSENRIRSGFVLPEAWARASTTLLSTQWNQTLTRQPATERNPSFRASAGPLALNERGVLAAFVPGSVAYRRAEHYWEAIDCLLSTLESVAALDPSREVLRKSGAQLSIDCVEPFCAMLPHEKPKNILSPRFDRAMACLLRARTFGADLHGEPTRQTMQRLFGAALQGFNGDQFQGLSPDSQSKMLKAAAASKPVNAREARVTSSDARPEGRNFAGSIDPAFTDVQVWAWRQKLLVEPTVPEWQSALKGWERKEHDLLELSQALKAGVMPTATVELLFKETNPKLALADDTRSVLEAHLLWVEIEQRAKAHPAVKTSGESPTAEASNEGRPSSTPARTLRL